MARYSKEVAVSVWQAMLTHFIVIEENLKIVRRKPV